MSLEQQLRTVLAEYAERPEVPRPDFDALTAGGLSLRRRRQQVVGATVGLALVGAIVAALAVGANPPDKRGGGDPADRPTSGLRVVASTGIAWCAPDPDDPDGKELIVGAGPPVTHWCSYSPLEGRQGEAWNPERANWLYHHAGSTILMSAADGLFRIANGDLTQLDTTGSQGVWFSHDGRYVVFQQGQCGPGVALLVHEVATADRVASSVAPDAGSLCYYTNGIDDRGRIYVTVAVEDSQEYESVLMYDMSKDDWTRVHGIPAGTGHDPISYLTADGFAVATEDIWVDAPSYFLPLASVEGVVDSQGRFSPQRDVPVGAGAWSLGRSWVVEARPDGVVAHPADQLTRRVVLDVPVTEYPTTWRFQWESSTSLLATSDPGTYRCDAPSGACHRLNRLGTPAADSGWAPG